MKRSAPSYLSSLNSKKSHPTLSSKEALPLIDKLQQDLLRSQQGLWHQKRRAILVLEGMDAAGKGGCIRRLTEFLDPRGIRVYPIGPPTTEEQGKHWLFRFWEKLPAPGTIAVFDRSWYGRVLVERVEKLTKKEDWKRAFKEINAFEAMLKDDGIELVKLYLAISKNEQLKRFESRLSDPYKQWKLTIEDVEARAKWDDYVDAVDEMFHKTHQPGAHWNFIPADDKHYARVEVLEVVTKALHPHCQWMEEHAQALHVKTVREALKHLGVKERKNF